MEKLKQLRFMARQLRVPASWLRDEALAGRVPHLNAGGQLLFHPETVEAVLAARAAREPSQGAGEGVSHAR